MEGWQTRGVSSSILLNRLLALKLRNFMSGNILGGGMVRSFIGRYLVGLEIENQGLLRVPCCLAGRVWDRLRGCV